MSLQKRWNDVCAATIGRDEFWYLSVDHRSAFASLGKLIAEHARGRDLDAGAGRLAWRHTLSRKASALCPKH